MKKALCRSLLGECHTGTTQFLLTANVYAPFSITFSAAALKPGVNKVFNEKVAVVESMHKNKKHTNRA